MQQLSRSLSANLAQLKDSFGQSADFYSKQVQLYGCPCAILLFDGMASLSSLWTVLLDAASRHTPAAAQRRLEGEQVFALIFHQSDLPAESTPVADMADLVRRMTAGMAVLLMDGCDRGIAFSVQNLKFRSVGEPEGEGNLRGSREGFSDLLRINLSLLRRLIRTEALVQEVAQADTPMATEYALCYCKGKASPQALEYVRKALTAAKPAMLLDSSYFLPWLLPASFRLFTPVSYTQRPAVAAAKLCEGKILVMVNGSPSALVLPALFSENFECLDDYGTTAFFSSFLRILKYASFALTVFLPGAFVCIAVYLPELLPPQLLYRIAAGNTDAIVCRDGHGDPDPGGDPGSGSPDAADLGPLCQSSGRIGHRGCRYLSRSDEHPGDLGGKHHIHCSICNTFSVRKCYRPSVGRGICCRAGRTGWAGGFGIAVFAGTFVGFCAGGAISV